MHLPRRLSEYFREQKQTASKADKVLRERQSIRLDEKEDGADGNGEHECLSSQRRNQKEARRNLRGNPKYPYRTFQDRAMFSSIGAQTILKIVKGFGAFPNKFVRVGSAVPCLPSMKVPVWGHTGFACYSENRRVLLHLKAEQT